MSGERLGARFAELLASRGVVVPPERVAHAVDFVRLLAGATLERADQLDLRIGALAAQVERRTALSRELAELLVRLAQAPQFRGRIEAAEMESFVARFGQAIGGLLAAEVSEDLDLAGYAARYGAAPAILLLDAMFAVAACDGVIAGPELRRLEAASAALGIDAVVLAALHRKHDPHGATGGAHVELHGDRIRIGRSTGADVVLPDPQVALYHVELIRTETGWRVVDAESGRPTVLNGRPITSAPLAIGDELRVGPFTLRLDPSGNALHVIPERSFTALSARDLTRTIGATSLLDQVGFTVFAGEVIAMVGPSGAGKTTLLNAIAGVTPADSGEVVLDGQDFHALLALDRSRVGIVPQDDIVHPELAVEESLYYSGRLRYPSAVSPGEVHAEVDRVLGELGIDHIRHNRIGDALHRGISGGQRKRVNLGQELLTRSTRVLFLDEPTSGLDPRAAQDIVRLVRQLADRGRIVFLVTHDLSPQVMAQVDHLMVLAPGGRLAWFGPPAEACRYFRVPTPDAIFNRFAEQTPEAWGQAYRASAAWHTYVQTREELIRLEGKPGQPIVGAGDQAPAVAVRRPLVHQLATLTSRYWRVKARDRTGLWVLAAQPPFLALVMALVFPKPTASAIFMLTLSCMWFGMSASVRELISDRVVFLRERRVGVGALPYVGSKVLVLGLLVVLQCAALCTFDWLAFDLGSVGFALDRLIATASLVGLCGMSLGLLMSALFLSSEAAVGTLPLLLIPQISFSSLLLSLKFVPASAHALSWLNPLRYGYDAMLKVALSREGEVWHMGKLFEPPRFGLEWQDPQSLTGPLYDLGLKGAAADDLGLTPGTLVGALVGFTTAFLLVALARVQARRSA